MDYRPILKERGKFLNVESCHPVSLHLAWPLAYVRRLWVRSSSLSLFGAAKADFLKRLVSSLVPSDVIGYVDNMTHFCVSSSHAGLKRKHAREAGAVLWQPLQYHPFQAAGLSRMLDNFFTSPE